MTALQTVTFFIAVSSVTALTFVTFVAAFTVVTAAAKNVSFVQSAVHQRWLLGGS